MSEIRVSHRLVAIRRRVYCSANKNLGCNLPIQTLSHGHLSITLLFINKMMGNLNFEQGTSLQRNRSATAPKKQPLMNIIKLETKCLDMTNMTSITSGKTLLGKE